QSCPLFRLLSSYNPPIPSIACLRVGNTDGGLVPPTAIEGKMLTAVDGEERPKHQNESAFAIPIILLTIASLVFAGCAGVVSGTNSTNAPPPPLTLTITNVQAGSATNSGFQVGWSTNLVATSAVDYGTTSSYGASTAV